MKRVYFSYKYLRHVHRIVVIATIFAWSISTETLIVPSLCEYNILSLYIYCSTYVVHKHTAQFELSTTLQCLCLTHCDKYW